MCDKYGGPLKVVGRRHYTADGCGRRIDSSADRRVGAEARVERVDMVAVGAV